MTYTVIWDPATEQELADIWMRVADRVAVTQAADRIDQVLKTAPEEQGESRDNDRRILLVLPLGVTFRVFEQDCLVRVIQVWHSTSRRGN